MTHAVLFYEWHSVDGTTLISLIGEITFAFESIVQVQRIVSRMFRVDNEHSSHVLATPKCENKIHRIKMLNDFTSKLFGNPKGMFDAMISSGFVICFSVAGDDNAMINCDW